MHFNRAIGIDSENGVLHIVEIRRRALRPHICKAYRLRIPANPDEAATVLERFARAQRMLDAPCVLGVSPETTLLRLFYLESHSRKSGRSEIREKLSQFRSIPLQDTFEAHTVLSSAGAGRRLLLGITRSDALEEQISLPSRAGCSVAAAIPAPLAVFETVASIRPKGQGSFLSAHIQEDKTLLSAGRGNDLLQTWTFPIGAHGVYNAENSESRERWLQNLRNCLHPAGEDARRADYGIKELIFSGAAQIPGELMEEAAKATGLPARKLSDLPRSKGAPDLQRYATAYGLALMGTSRSDNALSLIPSELRQRLALRWQLKYWMGCAAIVILSLAVAASSSRRTLKRQKRGYEERLRQLEYWKSLDGAIRETSDRNRSLRRELRPLQISARKGDVTRELLAALAAAKHADDWISLVADGPSYFTAEEKPESGRGEREAPGAGSELETRQVERVVVEGLTPSTDFSTIRSMIETLRNHPLVSSVDLLGDDKVRDDAQRDKRWAFTGARRFALEIKIKPSAFK